MKTTTRLSQLELPNQALLFDLEALYAQLLLVKDRRKRRGVRYPLAEMLMIGVLARLAGQTSSRAIAEWAQLRSLELAQLFALRRQCLPHFSTWSRILSKGCDPDEIEAVLGQFFAGSDASRSRPGERQLCIDDKTLRGTIPLGQSHGVHLVAAYLPQEGVVIGQIQVPNWGSEPPSAPRLLATLDLRATVVTGDAIFASRALSRLILAAKGDYLWIIKENQIQMYQDIQTLFAPQSSGPGWSAPPTDFRSASTFDKGHGRLEKRRLTVSSLLASYSPWPGLSQVFKLQRERTNALGETEREVCYGSPVCPLLWRLPNGCSGWFDPIGESKTVFIIAVTALWMKIALNCAWGMLLICWLCSTIQLLAC